MLSDRRHVKHFGILALCALVLSGCATSSIPPSGSAGERSTSHLEEIARNGTVIKVRAIYLNEERENPRTAPGTSARTLSQVGGSVLGSLAGDTTDEHADQTDGYEITVRLDNGELRTVSQQSDIHIKLNQRVQIISGSGRTRVLPN